MTRLRLGAVVLAVIVMFAIVSTNHAFAQSVTAKADVNGRMVVNFNNNAAVGGANDSGIAVVLSYGHHREHMKMRLNEE
jgi:uncharacterized membrane protein YphA (DoxX/SURF4 family)